MASVIVAVVAVVRVLVWAAAIIDTVLVVKVLVIDALAGVEIIVVGVMVTVDVPSDVDVTLFMDASAGAMLGVLTEIGIEVLPDVSANAFAVAMAASEFSR